MGQYSDLLNRYLSGLNISEHLRGRLNTENEIANLHEVIRLSYDLQAGTYIEDYLRRKNFYDSRMAYVVESFYPFLEQCSFVNKNHHILDLGVGEATTFTSFVKQLCARGVDVSCFGMDLSLSRLATARDFTAAKLDQDISFVVGNLTSIPFSDSSMDVCMTMHAIEPNRGMEDEILNEIIRVSRHFIILLEPIYETASNSERNHMNKHFYAQNILSAIQRRTDIQIIHDSILPRSLQDDNQSSSLLVIKKLTPESKYQDSHYICPIERTKLHSGKGFWLSAQGTCYPEIDGLPVLDPRYCLPYYAMSKQYN